MLTDPRQKTQKLAIQTFKFPNIHNPNLGQERSSSKEKDLSDPPKLKKAIKGPIPSGSNKQLDTLGKLTETVEKTQSQFLGICRQLLDMQGRQENFNLHISDQLFKLLQPKSMIISAAPQEPLSEEGEYRDRYFYVDLPQGIGRQIQWQGLTKWAFILFQRTFSVAFLRLSEKKLDKQQTKAFCSMNILRNLVRLHYNKDLSPDILSYLDKYLKQELLVYFQKKYPLTETKGFSRSLDSIVQETDNLAELRNNYFSSTSIEFEYRQSGNYNDLIMKMMNDIMTRIEMKSPYHVSKTMSNFADFKKYVAEIFQVIQEDEQTETNQEEFLQNIGDFIGDKVGRSMKSSYKDPSAAAKDSKIRSIQKEKYKQKVQQYTNFRISRKIPQNVELYTDLQIESMNLTIKHPSIFRILTKWCEELQKKFSNPQFFGNYSDNIMVQKGGCVNSLLFPMRMVLDEELKQQGKRIQHFLQSLSASNYQMQLQLLRKQGKDQDQLFSKGDPSIENTCGRFSVQMLNNMNSYLSAYLNRLIHGLMCVAQKFYLRCKLSGDSNWPSPPNLLTFTIGDLLRCKVSSRERQIQRIYQQIRALSSKFPQKIKVVRIKNRLNLSTNDILLNVRFNNSILCQMQLAVKTEVSDFIKCSNAFCHYIYQLQRSPFGAIAQLCNVWANLDLRADFYKLKIRREVEKHYQKRTHLCQKTAKRSSFQKPFICYTCQLVYYHSNYLRPHHHCLACSRVICAKCQLKQEKQSDLVENMISNKRLRKDIDAMIDRLQTSREITYDQLPEYGVCLYVQRRSPKAEVFRRVKYKGLTYILSRNTAGEIYEIQEIGNEKDLAQFLRKYVIFKLNNINNSHLQLEQQQAIQSFILPKLIKKWSMQQRQSIVLGSGLSDYTLEKVLKSFPDQGKKKIGKLFLDHNQIHRFSSFIKGFPNLQLLQLSYNKISPTQELFTFADLKSISLVACELQEIPDVIFRHRQLQELRISQNQIVLLNQKICQLTRLKILDISNNSLVTLPDSLVSCTQLIILRCQSNKIREIPKALGNLSSLRRFLLKKNELSTLPMQFSALEIEELDISMNFLEELPSNFGQMKNLLNIDLSGNKLLFLNESFGSLEKLIYLNLSKNKQLSTLPSSFAELSQLSTLNLSNCSFSYIPHQLYQLHNLKDLDISYNQIERISKEISKIAMIKQLNLSNNLILWDQGLRDAFSKMTQLQEIYLNHNHVSKFPNFYFCQHIKTVDMSHNSLEEVESSDLYGLTGLQNLNLSHNAIMKLTDQIVLLKELKQFDISFNRLKEIQSIENAERITIWPQITRINLQANELSDLPPCLLKSQNVGNLENLVFLNIKSNKVEKLPNELSGLRKLRQFSCANNNVKALSNELQAFMKGKKLDIDIKQLNLNQEELTSPLKRRNLSKRQSRNGQKLLK